MSVFSPEQVKCLNDYQESGVMHPFTCGYEHPEPKNLIATEAGWICPFPGCTYTQAWAHSFMLSFDLEKRNNARTNPR